MIEFLASDALLFLILMLTAAVVAGFLAGLFGIGGGAVMVPVFSEMFVLFGTQESLAHLVAIGTSLAVIIPTSIQSARTHQKNGHIDMAVVRLYFFFVPFGVFLGLVFANLNWVKTTNALTLIFGVMALSLAIYMLFMAREFRLSEGGPRTPTAQIGATFIGFTSLLMGIGGGVMNNIFMMVQGTAIKRAIGTSAAVGALIAIPGAIGFVFIGWQVPGVPPFTVGYVNYLAVGAMIPITVLMAPIGARATHHLPDQLTSRLFGLFLVVVGARMLWKIMAG